MGELKGLDSTEKLEVVIPLAREQLKGTNFPADALATAIHEQNWASPVQKMIEQVSRVTAELKRLNDKQPEAFIFLAAAVRKDPKYLENLIDRPKEIVDGLLKVADASKQFSKIFFTNLAKKEALNDVSALITYLFDATAGGLSEKEANIFIARTTAINTEPHKAIAAEVTAKVTELADKKYTLAEEYMDSIPTPFCLGLIFAIETWGEPKLHEQRVDRSLISSFEKRWSNKEFTWDSLFTDYLFQGNCYFSYVTRQLVLGYGSLRSLDQKYIDNFSHRVLSDRQLSSGEILNLVQRYRQIHELWQKYTSKETVSFKNRQHLAELMWRGVRKGQPEVLNLVAQFLTTPKIDVSQSLAHLTVFTYLSDSTRLGLFLTYTEAKKIVKTAGLNSNDPIIVLNFAYGYAVLGDARKVIALNSQWGVIHFMGFSSAKILAAYSTLNRMRSGKKLNSDTYVYMRASDDHNSALYKYRTMDPDPPKGAAVVIGEAATDVQWRGQIKHVGEKVGTIVYYTEHAHGDPEYFQLGRYEVSKEKANVKSDEMKQLRLAELNKYFAKGAIVVLSGCELGKGQISGMPVALSWAWPNVRLFAGPEEVYGVNYFAAQGEKILIPLFRRLNDQYMPTRLYEKGVLIAEFNEKDGTAARSAPKPLKLVKIEAPIGINLTHITRKRRSRGPNT